MWGRIERAMFNVNQMGDFWYFFILMSQAGELLNQGHLE
jgi:hypothetical protein